MKAFFEKNKIFIGIIIGAFIIGGFIYLSNQSNPVLPKENPENFSLQENKIQATASQPVQEKTLPLPVTINTGIVDYVIDGDTVELKTGERIRLIGINAPETGQPYSSEAKNKLKELIEGKKVRLEKDITDKDQYGRLLRYVWLDNVFVNLEMVKQGYANSYTYPPDIKYQEQIIAAEKQAREAKTGLWAPAQTSKDEATHIFTFPSFYFAPNANLTLYSGSSTNTTDRLYWNRADEKYAIWNNSGDVVYLRDGGGGLVLEYGY